MTLDELKKGESESVEFKKNIPQDKDKFLKTAIAFANGAGGRIVFGVENNSWKVTGFPMMKCFRSLMQLPTVFLMPVFQRLFLLCPLKK